MCPGPAPSWPLLRELVKPTSCPHDLVPWLLGHMPGFLFRAKPAFFFFFNQMDRLRIFKIFKLWLFVLQVPLIYSFPLSFEETKLLLQHLA